MATGPSSGDICFHTWEINADPDAFGFTDPDLDPMPGDDSNVTLAPLDADGEPFVTFYFACFRRHTEQDANWAADNAAAIRGG